MTDHSPIDPPRLHSQLSDIELQLEGLQARIERASALAERWVEIGATHGPRTFTGNDHLLFANELKAALSPRELKSKRVAAPEEGSNEPICIPAESLGQIMGILGRTFPDQDDWTLEAAAVSISVVIADAYKAGGCMIYAVQGELEEWFDIQLSDTRPLVYELLTAAELEPPVITRYDFSQGKLTAIAESLTDSAEIPEQLASLVATCMIAADQRACTTGSSRKEALSNELDRWVALPERGRMEHAVRIYTACPIQAQCLEITRPLPVEPQAED